MDCLLCYRVFIRENEFQNYHANPQFCKKAILKLFQILSDTDVQGLSEDLVICPGCQRKLETVWDFLDQLEELQRKVEKAKMEIKNEMIQSKEISQAMAKNIPGNWMSQSSLDRLTLLKAIGTGYTRPATPIGVKIETGASSDESSEEEQDPDADGSESDDSDGSANELDGMPQIRTTRPNDVMCSLESVQILPGVSTANFKSEFPSLNFLFPSLNKEIGNTRTHSTTHDQINAVHSNKSTQDQQSQDQVNGPEIDDSANEREMILPVGAMMPQNVQICLEHDIPQDMSTVKPEVNVNLIPSNLKPKLAAITSEESSAEESSSDSESGDDIDSESEAGDSSESSEKNQVQAIDGSENEDSSNVLEGVLPAGVLELKEVKICLERVQLPPGTSTVKQKVRSHLVPSTSKGGYFLRKSKEAATVIEESISGSEQPRRALGSNIKGLNRLENGSFQCSKIIPKKKSFCKHILIHSPRRFKCSVRGCERRFTQKGHLNTHVKTVHEKRRDFKCTREGCGRGFGEKSALTRHVKVVHEGRRDFKCGVEGCGHASGSKGNLNKHMLRKHKNMGVTKKKRVELARVISPQPDVNPKVKVELFDCRMTPCQWVFKSERLRNYHEESHAKN